MRMFTRMLRKKEKTLKNLIKTRRKLIDHIIRYNNYLIKLMKIRFNKRSRTSIKQFTKQIAVMEKQGAMMR